VVKLHKHHKSHEMPLWRFKYRRQAVWVNRPIPLLSNNWWKAQGCLIRSR
jgi:hypothetical protein